MIFSSQVLIDTNVITSIITIDINFPIYIIMGLYRNFCGVALHHFNLYLCLVLNPWNLVYITWSQLFT